MARIKKREEDVLDRATVVARAAAEMSHEELVARVAELEAECDILDGENQYQEGLYETVITRLVERLARYETVDLDAVFAACRLGNTATPE